MLCPFCQEEIKDGAKKCKHCGEFLDGSKKDILSDTSDRIRKGTKSKGVAILLCLFLGGIGGHKFYLGQTTSGVIYLLLSWTFIPCLIALVEFIQLLCTSDEEFDKKYN